MIVIQYPCKCTLYCPYSKGEYCRFCSRLPYPVFYDTKKHKYYSNIYNLITPYQLQTREIYASLKPFK